MKFVVERDQLLDALQRAARIAARPGGKNLIPILTHVKIETRKVSGIRISAHDTLRQVEIQVPTTELGKPGITTVGAKALQDFVSGCPDGAQIELEQPRVDARLTIRADRAKAALATLPADDFPAFADQDCGDPLELDARTFATTLASVAHAQSNETTRFYLNGIYVHRRSSRELVCVATDGHRLARTVMETAHDLPEDLPGVIVPTSAIGELIGLAGKAEVLRLEIGQRFLRASIDSIAFTTRLVDGVFPDYERVIPPADVATGFDAAREAFARTAKRCAAIVTDKARAVKLTPQGNVLELLGRDLDLGEITDAIDAETTTKMPIGVNTRYLVAALDALTGSTVRVRYANPGAQVAITDPAEPNRLQVVMPMRV
jgi:DNA polymerase-3 subunit beta